MEGNNRYSSNCFEAIILGGIALNIVHVTSETRVLIHNALLVVEVLCFIELEVAIPLCVNAACSADAAVVACVAVRPAFIAGQPEIDVVESIEARPLNIQTGALSDDAVSQTEIVIVHTCLVRKCR